MPPRLNGSARASVSRAFRASSLSHRASNVWLQSSTVTVTVTVPSRQYAAVATTNLSLAGLKLPDNYIPPTQPPTARRPDQRKAQLLRSYTALLRATPLILFFQHNNVTAVEWAAIRREMRGALAAVPVPAAAPDGGVPPVDIARNIDLQVIRTRIFSMAYKIVEYFDPEAHKNESNAYTHDLSSTAYETVKEIKADPMSSYGQMFPVLQGQIMAVTFPAVSPDHLAAVLKILAPSPPAFPAPTRRKNPGYYETTAQSGLQKLILVGGRVEGRVFDNEGVKWVGGIEGGLDTLRARLVNMLQSAGLGLTTALEGQSKGLWLALESRRTQMDEEANGGKKDEEASGDKKDEAEPPKAA